MTGPSIKELNQYRKARSKINDIVNKYGIIENLFHLFNQNRKDKNNLFKSASSAVRNYQRNQNKVEIFESKFGNLDDDLNHCAPPQDAHPPAQDQLPLSLSFANGCPCHSSYETCSNPIDPNIHGDRNEQPINNPDSNESIDNNNSDFTQ